MQEYPPSNKELAKKILEDAEKRVEELKAKGWTQKDFAAVLGKLFNE